MDKKQYTKLEHYVPRAYLKQFSFLERGDYYTYCLFKKDRRIKKLKIDNICAVNDLYELYIFDEYKERNFIEDSFIELEGQYSELCSKIIFSIENKNKITLSSQELDILKKFISLLVFRSKHSIEIITRCALNLAKDMPLNIDRLYEILEDTEPDVVKEEIFPYVNECYGYSLAFAMMKQILNTKDLYIIPKLLKEEMGPYCCFLYDERGLLISSDMPFCNIYDKESKYFPLGDFLCFPISPKLYIAFFEENEEYNNQILLINIEQIEILNRNHIKKCSTLYISPDEKVITEYLKNHHSP